MTHVFVVETQQNGVHSVKDCAKTSAKDSRGASSDCWVPRDPFRPHPPSVAAEVTTNQNGVHSVKDCAKTSAKDSRGAGSDCWVPRDPFRPHPPSVVEVATKQLGGSIF
jgi:hypothetical protein